jgi:Holliday junction resolvase-like predicted endonuclease
MVNRLSEPTLSSVEKSAFQQASTRQGREFEDTICFFLKSDGWKIEERRYRIHGEEIDIVATDPDGDEWWIECKGSYEGKIPGGRRIDTKKKAVAVAYSLSHVIDRPYYMLYLSHYPFRGTYGDRMLTMALEDGLFTEVRSLVD